MHRSEVSIVIRTSSYLMGDVFADLQWDAQLFPDKSAELRLL